MDKDVPLIVPEVNPNHITDFKKKNIIANPNCSTIQMVTALSPLHKEFTIKKVFVSTYQAVSGAEKRLWMNYLIKLKVYMLMIHLFLNSLQKNIIQCYSAYRRIYG